MMKLSPIYDYYAPLSISMHSLVVPNQIPFLFHLQFKERDMVEGIFKFWRHPDESTFDIRRHWLVLELT